MNPGFPPYPPYPPLPRMRPFPPPPPPENPFPTLDPEPMATKEELDAEVARAKAAESGVVDAAVAAATSAMSGEIAAMQAAVSGSLESMQASVTAAVSGANAAANHAASVTSGIASQAAAEAAAEAVSGLFSGSGLGVQVADAAAEKVRQILAPALASLDTISDKADKSYVDACLKQGVLMTQSPDGLSQIQIGNDGVPFVLKAKPFQAVWTDTNNVEHKFGWVADESQEDEGSYFFPEDASTASGVTRFLRKAKEPNLSGLYWYGVRVSGSGGDTLAPQGYATFSSGLWTVTGENQGSLTVYETRVTRRNIVTEAVT